MRRANLIVSTVLWLSAVAMTTSVFVPQAQAQAPEQEFTIAIGETLTLPSKSISQATVGLPAVADMKLAGNEFLITGLAPGVTTINLYHSRKGARTFLVRVVQVNPTSLAEEAREVLGDRSGVDVRVVKGRVILEGEVASETFKRRIEKLVELYPLQVLNFATFRESFVEGAKMVAIDIDFIQLARTTRDNLGFNWGNFLGANLSFGTGDVPLYYSSASAGGGGGGGGGGGDASGQGVLPGERNPARLPLAVPLTGGSGLNSYFSLVGNLNLALDLLQENGIVKTRQHGVLVTEAGKEAEYRVGGQINISLANAVESINYGLLVTVKPIVDVDNRVKLELLTTYSTLDLANSVGEVPSLRDSRFKSVVNMQEGQSVLVAGLTSYVETSNELGFWLLGDIPILGWLFKGRSYLKESQDNALFVTPRLYEPGKDTHREIIRGIFSQMIEAGLDAEELPKMSNAPGSVRKGRRPASGAKKDAFDE